MQQRRDYLREHHDALRRAVVCEPKGHEAIVGALLTPPVNPGSASGVIFFNDVGYLGMCGHGLIGTVETLRFMGALGKGAAQFAEGALGQDSVQLDTPAGTVTAEIEPDGTVVCSNVHSYLYRGDVALEVPGLGRVTGDIAYGGNWFFLVHSYAGSLSMSRIDELMRDTMAIRRILEDRGIAGPEGERIDHIELYGEPTNPAAHSKNFVLCPGNAYDRSPCGTGTSAKMAVLHAKGQLAVGQKWVQQSITGSLFEGNLEQKDGQLIPVIRSKAFVMSRATLYFNPEDPFTWGIPRD
jgi:4-hydroxyproline epimerase